MADLKLGELVSVIESLVGSLMMKDKSPPEVYRIRGRDGEPVFDPYEAAGRGIALAAALLNPAAIALGRKIEAAHGDALEDDEDAATPGAGASVLSRLDMAQRLALAERIFRGDEEGISEARRVSLDLLRVVCEESDASPEATARVAEWRRLTAPRIDTPQGPKANGLWLHPAFALPAVAALAQFWDRLAAPDGDSLLTLQVRPQAGALFHYELTALTVRAGRRDEDGHWRRAPLQRDERLRVSTLLAAAAQFFLLDGDWMRVAASILASEAGRAEAPDAPSVRTPISRVGSSPFILCETMADTLAGGGSSVEVEPRQEAARRFNDHFGA